MQILQQLGWLFLKSVPTIILFLLFYWFLRANFFKPLERTMAERNARFIKAREEAAAVQASAKGQVQSYEDALKKAQIGRASCRDREEFSERESALKENNRELVEDEC